MRKKQTRRPRCYCGAELMVDGTCRWKCPAEAKPSNLRKQNALRRANERRSTRINLTDEEKKRASDAVAKLDPVYKRQRGLLFGAALKSHAPGSRR